MAARPKIVVVKDPLSPYHWNAAAERTLSAIGEREDVFIDPAHSAAEREAALDDRLSDADALLFCGWESMGVGFLSAERLSRCAKLAFVASTAHYRQAEFIDVDAGLEHGIVFSETAPAMSPWVAEYELTLALSVLREVPQDHAVVSTGGWVEFAETKDQLDRLESCRAGLVSFGEIHRNLARYLGAFGVDWETFDPYVSPELAHAAGGRKADDLVAMAARSDVFFVAVPDTPETIGLIDRAVIEALPRDAVFVLVSRMQVVEQEPLLERLTAGDLRAGIDVFDPEPPPADSPFRMLPNVVHTPHRGGNTFSAQRAIFSAQCEDARRHFAGEPLRHPLRPEMVALFK
jgi:phosphoglycerate dehydrogenase-like enzyme